MRWFLNFIFLKENQADTQFYSFKKNFKIGWLLDSSQQKKNQFVSCLPEHLKELDGCRSSFS
jgi:hypothetical protein